jgi:hypothetical protein
MAGAPGKLQKIQSTDSEFNRFQNQLIPAFNLLCDQPFSGGNLVRAVVLNNQQENYISHGLGRNYIGYVITRRYNCKGFIDIYESDVVNNNRDKYVIFNCFDTLTCDIFFF